MAIAANLEDAAQIAYDNLQAKNLALTLYTDFGNFIQDLIAVFPDDGTQAERTVGNWIVVGMAAKTAVAASVFVGVVPARKFNALALFVFRLCEAARNAQNAGRITAAQGNAILAAYNARFG